MGLWNWRLLWVMESWRVYGLCGFGFRGFERRRAGLEIWADVRTWWFERIWEFKRVRGCCGFMELEIALDSGELAGLRFVWIWVQRV